MRYCVVQSLKRVTKSFQCDIQSDTRIPCRANRSFKYKDCSICLHVEAILIANHPVEFNGRAFVGMRGSACSTGCLHGNFGGTPRWANTPVPLQAILPTSYQHCIAICTATLLLLFYPLSLPSPLMCATSVMMTAIETGCNVVVGIVLPLHFLFLFGLWEILWIDRLKSTRKTVWQVRDNNKGEYVPALGSKDGTLHHAMPDFPLSQSQFFWQTHCVCGCTHTRASTLSVAISPVVKQVAQWDLHLLVAHFVFYPTIVVDCWFLVISARPHRRSSWVAMVVVSQIRRCSWVFLSGLHGPLLWALICKLDLAGTVPEKEFKWLRWHFCLQIDIYIWMLMVCSSSVGLEKLKYDDRSCHLVSIDKFVCGCWICHPYRGWVECTMWSNRAIRKFVYHTALKYWVIGTSVSNSLNISKVTRISLLTPPTKQKSLQ